MACYYPSYVGSWFKFNDVILDVAFITRVMIKAQSGLPLGRYIGQTTKTIADEFIGRYNTGKLSKNLVNPNLVLALHSLVYKSDKPQITALNSDDGLVQFAENTNSLTGYKPVVVIKQEAKPKFIERAVAFYKTSPEYAHGFKASDIPFDIWDYKETRKALLKEYSTICQEVDKTTKFATDLK